MKKWVFLVVMLLLLTGLFTLPFLTVKTNNVANSKFKQQSTSCDITIQVEGQKQAIPLEQYLLGVVAGEMPVAFHKEALKAQAIAARTYVLKSTEGGKKPISPTVLRQVYIDEQQRKEKWGNYFSGNEAKLREILSETKGQVLTYNGDLITAMFHSMSNGQTESAQGFSGNEIPYLISVDSGWEKALPNFQQQKKITAQKWHQIFGLTKFDTIQLQRNASGRVEKMVANSGQWEGREVRELLDLRSTDFEIAYNTKEKMITVTTRGYGHGVGMSQYGANEMAKSGKETRDILAHYYQTAEISSWDKCLK